MRVVIKDCDLMGTNLDGNHPFGDDFHSPTQAVFVGWTMIGPRYVGKPTLRQKIAWWLLGINVKVASGNRITGCQEQEAEIIPFRVIQGSANKKP